MKAFECDECKLSGKDTLSRVNEEQALLLITVKPPCCLSGLAAVIQHKGLHVVYGENQKKKDDTQPQSPVQNRIKPPPPTLVWTLQMARSQLENRLCFVKECTSPTRQVRVRGKRNHRSTHALTRATAAVPSESVLCWLRFRRRAEI